jgi:hypothetical protein
VVSGDPIDRRELYLLHLGMHTNRALEAGSAGLYRKTGVGGVYDEKGPRIPGILRIPMEICVLSHAMGI